MLSLVVPSYNEGKHIYDNLINISKVLEDCGTDYEIVPVNDGSPDNTEEEIKSKIKELKTLKDSIDILLLNQSISHNNSCSSNVSSSSTVNNASS